MGKELSDELKEVIRKLLQANNNIFAWFAQDMLRVDWSIIEHKFSIKKEAKPIRQKKRSFAREQSAAIATKV